MDNLTTLTHTITAMTFPTLAGVHASILIITLWTASSAAWAPNGYNVVDEKSGLHPASEGKPPTISKLPKDGGKAETGADWGMKGSHHQIYTTTGPWMAIRKEPLHPVTSAWDVLNEMDDGSGTIVQTKRLLSADKMAFNWVEIVAYFILPPAVLLMLVLLITVTCRKREQTTVYDAQHTIQEAV